LITAAPQSLTHLANFFVSVWPDVANGFQGRYMNNMGEAPLPCSEDDAHPYVTRGSIFQELNSAEPVRRNAAWKNLMARYGPIVGSFAKRCGASQQDIEDIVQDVMAGFYAVSPRFEYDPAVGRFRGWLKTCTLRAAIRRAGKNLKFRGVPLEEVPDVDAAVQPVWEDLWEKELVARALQLLRKKSSERLPFRIFEQYVLLDRAAQEVADELDTTVENVHQAKSRMTRELRQIVSRLRKADE
jgi:RNA polymerase sigma factor (sigma-70 family)